MTAASGLALWAALALAPQPAPGTCALPGISEPARIPGVPFDELQQRADTAWDAADLPEALRYYRAGVELNPRWVNGLWRLGLLFWMGDCHLEASGALGRLVVVAPESSQGWALLGVSEYRLQEYDKALAHLIHGTEMGLVPGAITLEAQHALALLLVRAGDYPAAGRVLNSLVRAKPDEMELVAACGLLALRRPLLPSDIAVADQDLVMTAGRAAHAAFSGQLEQAWKGFDELLARYPTTPGVHLAYGMVLSHEAAPRAVAMLRKEVELFPDNAAAQTALALEILNRGDPAEALEPARAAVELTAGSFSSRLAFGRALLATEALDEAIVELEEAARLDPESVDVHVALAQAYQAAGRPEDVERARQTLTELYRKREGAQ